MLISRLLALAITSLTLAGCAGFQDPPQISCAYTSSQPMRVYGNTLPELTYAAVQKITFCAGPSLSERVPIIVSSITDSRRLETSSTFGNVVADFARTRLAQMHMDVSEPRLRSTMLLKTDEGEMMLSRDPHALVSSPPTSAILTGTYGVGEGSIFVSLKLIRGDNAQILSGADFVVWRSGDVNNLLGG